MKSTFCLSAFALSLLVGCGDESLQKRSVRSAETSPLAINEVEVEARLAANFTNKSAKVVNAVGLDAFRMVSADHPGQNVAVSPLALTLPLAMFFEGARGATQTQFTEFFAWPDTSLAFRSDLSSLVAQEIALAAENSANVLEVTNSLWVQHGLPLVPAFVSALTDSYGAPVARAPFATDPVLARGAINSWADNKSYGLMPQIVSAESVSRETKAVAASIVYFSAKWARPFDGPNAGVEPMSFFPESTKKVAVPGLVRHAAMPYLAGADWQAVEMDYEGSRFSMILILPNEGKFGAVEAALTGGLFDQIAADRVDTPVWFAMPKFTVRTFVDLKKTLVNMGLPSIFSPSTANLTGISNTPLHLSYFQTGSVISVDEWGTLAAGSAFGSLYQESADPIVLFDRPFFFAIRDKVQGAILFVGRVMDPTQ